MPATINIRTSESTPFIILPTFIDGKGPFDFVLDTAANVAIASEKLAGLLEVQNAERKEALGIGRPEGGVSVGRVDSVAVGGAKVEGARVGIMKSLPRCVGDGVLGHDFLRHFRVIIDYRASTVTFVSAAEHEDAPGEFMPLRLARPDRPLVLVDARVNGRKLYQWILDTGASQTVVSPALAREMAVRSQEGDALVGAGGVVPSSSGILESLGIEAISLRNVRVMISDIFDSLAQVTGTRIDGIVGYNVLRQLKITLDFPGGKLNLQDR